MDKLWFAVEDPQSVSFLKNARTASEVDLSWFPATGELHRPFPTLLEAVKRADLDALYYEATYQPLPTVSLLRQVPTVLSLDANPLRPFTRERLRPLTSPFANLLDNRPERNLHSARHAAGLVVWSEWARQTLTAKYEIDPLKILVARVGSDLTDWDASQEAFRITRRRQLGLPERIRLLMTGDDFEGLGGDLLLDVLKSDPALAELCELHLIVTRRASFKSYLSTDLDLPIHLHSYHEPAELYLNADIFVMPARQPTSPAQLATPLAAGLPIIASSHLAELVEDGSNGLLTAPGDGRELHAAISRLVDDPTLRNQLGQAGRRLAEAQFNAAITSQQILNFVRQIASQSRTSYGKKPLEVGGWNDYGLAAPALSQAGQSAAAFL